MTELHATEPKERYVTKVSETTQDFLDTLTIIAARSDAVDKRALLAAQEHFKRSMHRLDRVAAWRDALSKALAERDRKEHARILGIYDT